MGRRQCLASPAEWSYSSSGQLQASAEKEDYVGPTSSPDVSAKGKIPALAGNRIQVDQVEASYFTD
jgi:hypothetical protein